MNRLNYEQYLTSMITIKKFKKEGLITDAELAKVEKIIAKKYCIKKDSLIRENSLIQNHFRAIYDVTKKE